ncbi:hypothetical protein ACFV2L_14165 [Streptomyces sp. NPDC059687]|uniref:hypothetical protein n=1 Tax=unclassified Streptomyces TaxID=2593676 RepID=UPI0034392DF4
MKAWKSGVALGATVLACTLGLITAGPASASGTVATAGGEAAVNFESYGEHFTVHDYKADGRATAGYMWALLNGSWHQYPEVVNRNGYAGSAVTVNYSIPEGTQVAYQACLGTSGTGQECTDFHYDTA